MPAAVTALLPMRHRSERVPGKNYRSFAGRPLFEHALSALLACPLVAEVVIDTDSPTVREAVAGRGRVRAIDRPEHLRAGEVPMNDVLLHDTAVVGADLYLQTHSTNPLLRAATIERAIAAYLEQASVYDSLFSVTPIRKRLWDGLARPVNHNPAILLRTQDLPPLFEENSCIYIFTREVLARRRNRIGDRPLLFEMDPVEAFDIDTESDFRVAEMLFRDREDRAEVAP